MCNCVGAPEEEVAQTHFGTYLRYHKGIEKYKKFKEAKRDHFTELEVVVGVPGCGKTQGTKKAYPDAYWKDKSKWWPRYEGQDVVVCDEMHGYVQFHEFLRLCDNTPMCVEQKGLERSFISKKIVAISNKPPHEWYNFQEEKLEWKALERRIKEIRYHQKGDSEPYPEPRVYPGSKYKEFAEDWEADKLARKWREAKTPQARWADNNNDTELYYE